CAHHFTPRQSSASAAASPPRLRSTPSANAFGSARSASSVRSAALSAASSPWSRQSRDRNAPPPPSGRAFHRRKPSVRKSAGDGNVACFDFAFASSVLLDSGLGLLFGSVSVSESKPIRFPFGSFSVSFFGRPPFFPTTRLVSRCFA